MFSGGSDPVLLPFDMTYVPADPGRGLSELLAAVGRHHWAATSFTSTDGSTWSETPANPATLGDRDPQATSAFEAGMMSVVRNVAAANLVAVGWIRPISGDMSPRLGLWYSNDGQTWSIYRLNPTLIAPYTNVDASLLLRVGSELYAIGYGSTGTTYERVTWVWSSGTGWARVSRDHPVLGATSTAELRNACSGVAGFAPSGWVVGGFREGGILKAGVIWDTDRWRPLRPFIPLADPLANSRVVADCTPFETPTFKGTVFVGSATVNGVPVGAVWRYGVTRFPGM